MEITRPTSRTAVAMSMVGPTPNCATLVGNRKVPIAAPTRLIARVDALEVGRGGYNERENREANQDHGHRRIGPHA
jgi:hypothetical protein